MLTAIRLHPKGHRFVESTEPVVIAVWPKYDDDEPETARLFTGDDYANWNEYANLSGPIPQPAHFYGITADGTLMELTHTITVSPYDDNDYATVAHTWSHPDDPITYTTGYARRDGRA
jgi:hypothetical protein